MAFLTDLQIKPDDLASVVNRISAQDDIDFVITLGDLTENGLELEYEWSCKSLERLNTPHRAIIGNHDAISFGKQIWQEFFDPYDYSFNFLGTKFIAYNANALEFPGAPNFEWMEAEATLTPDETRFHTIGLSHVPPVVDMHSFKEVEEIKEFLFNNGFDYTLHEKRAGNFALWLNELGMNHFIVADIDDERYATMTVFRDRVEFEACSPDCQPITAQ